MPTLAKPWPDMDLIFISTIGRHVDVGDLIYRSFRPLPKRAETPRIRFHDLRHTCSAILVSENVNPKIVQVRVGRANISETMDTYMLFWLPPQTILWPRRTSENAV
jgi:integrase